MDTRSDIAPRDGHTPPSLAESATMLASGSSIANFRDVGGLATTDGRRVRNGLLYRSGALDALVPADIEMLERLGIRTIYDLRTRLEREERPDCVPKGVTHVGLDVLDGLEDAAPGRIMALLSEPRTAHQALGDGKGAAMFLGQYRAFVAFETSRQAYGRLFADLIDPSRRPALIHCQGGKDRTGWAAAALLLLLGVPMAAVVDDYVASNAHLRPGFERFFADFEARGGDARLLTELFGVRRDYLEASLLEVRERFGTVERYVAEGFELGDAGVAALREAFLE